jgi:4-carboxymuconolactone decarboxylase
MNKKLTVILAGIFISVLNSVTISEAQTMKSGGLNTKQEKVVTIAAFTANGDLQKLKTALNEGLDAGLTINEIKEILVQMYAYAGFPRSLNGINTFIGVLEERQQKGIKDELGKEPSPMPADKSSIELGTEIQTRLIGAPATGKYITFAPAIDQFLKGHLFGDIFGRDNLNFQSREIATISALANMEGVNPQLQSHFIAGFNVGLTEAQVRSLISVLEAKVGKKQADNASEIFGKVLSNRAKKEQAESMTIRLKVGDKVFTATLIDSKTTQDFISLLPLTLTMNDLFRREKYAHLPRAISEKGKRTHTYEVGDVVYWPTGPDVAIFYRHDGQEIPDPGVIVIGKIDSGVEALNVPGSVEVTVELIK